MVSRRLRVIMLCIGLLITLGVVILLRPSPALYKVTVLPYPGAGSLTVCGINDHGQIVGRAPTGTGQAHLLLWERGKDMRDLGPVAGDWVAINNAGQIVGTMVDPDGKEQAFLWNPNSGRQLLGLLGGIGSKGLDINDRGQVVGTIKLSADVSHVFLWDRANGMRDLGPTHPRAINNAGQVIVVSNGRRLLMDAGTGDVATALQLPLKGLGRINNHGWMTGLSQSSVAKPDKIDVVMWHPRASTKVLAQVNVRGGENGSINDANQVLIMDLRPPIWLLGKTIIPARTKCYLHDPQRGLISLNRYLGGDPYVMDLNNQGCIVGTIQSRDNRRSTGVLLEPIPERWGR
jgi:probable HAF family extracellular repeat protein